MDFKRYLKEYPNKEGRFGKFGGAYLPEQLVPAFEEITEAYLTICHSSQFINELRRIRREFQGRPTPVYHCERLPLYTNSPIHYEAEELRATLASADYLTACSSSAIHHLVELLEQYQLTDLLRELPIAVLGEQTAGAVRSYGLDPQLIAPQATIPSLVGALIERLG